MADNDLMSTEAALSALEIATSTMGCNACNVRTEGVILVDEKEQRPDLSATPNELKIKLDVIEQNILPETERVFPRETRRLALPFSKKISHALWHLQIRKRTFRSFTEKSNASMTSPRRQLPSCAVLMRNPAPSLQLTNPVACAYPASFGRAFDAYCTFYLTKRRPRKASRTMSIHSMSCGVCQYVSQTEQYDCCSGGWRRQGCVKISVVPPSNSV
jgi:hypothetical protein